jgi:hypothetical protein
VNAPTDGSERLQPATPSAQDRARHESKEVAEKKEPMCASMIPRNSGWEQSIRRGNDGDHE